MKSLQTIDLSQNQIQIIFEKAFDGLESIEKIDLRDNLITNIYHRSFHGLYKLRLLYLERNRFETIQNDWVKELLEPEYDLISIFITDNPLVCDCDMNYVGK